MGCIRPTKSEYESGEYETGFYYIREVSKDHGETWEVAGKREALKAHQARELSVEPCINRELAQQVLDRWNAFGQSVNNSTPIRWRYTLLD